MLLSARVRELYQDGREVQSADGDCAGGLEDAERESFLSGLFCICTGRVGIGEKRERKERKARWKINGRRELLNLERDVGYMLMLFPTGPNARCFFYRGGMHTLSSDQFEEILKQCFIYRCATTG